MPTFRMNSESESLSALAQLREQAETWLRFWTGCGSISPRRCGCFVEGNPARFSPFGVGEHVGEHDVLPSTVTAGKTDPDDI